MRKFYFLGEIFVKSSQVFEKSNDFSGFGKVDEKVGIARREISNLSEKLTFFSQIFIQISFF